jgi:hypothetical protein
MRAERDEKFQTAGETPQQRAARHRQERREQQRWASAMWRVPNNERVKRFRRWCVLTALSASAGYGMGAVQFVSHLPYGVEVGALCFGWVLDLWLRGNGRVRVSGARGPAAIGLLVLVRIPFASALAAACHLAPLLAATGHLIHHH